MQTGRIGGIDLFISGATHAGSSSSSVRTCLHTRVNPIRSHFTPFILFFDLSFIRACARVASPRRCAHRKSNLLSYQHNLWPRSVLLSLLQIDFTGISANQPIFLGFHFYFYFLNVCAVWILRNKVLWVCILRAAFNYHYKGDFNCNSSVTVRMLFINK